VLVAVEGYDCQVCLNKMARRIDRNRVNVMEVETKQLNEDAEDVNPMGLFLLSQDSCITWSSSF
jgi:predicted DNA-binding helix-hairpin-helix protein